MRRNCCTPTANIERVVLLELLGQLNALEFPLDALAPAETLRYRSHEI